MNRIPQYVILLALLFFVAPPPTPAVEPTRYRMSSLGDLFITVPDGWKDRKRKAWANAPPHIEFSSSKGSLFKLSLKPARSLADDPQATNPENVREFVTQRAETAQIQSAAPTLPLVELHGDHAFGFLYQFLDKNPDPSALTCWTLGTLVAGDLLVFIELHTRSFDSPEQQAALAALETMHFVPKEER